MQNEDQFPLPLLVVLSVGRNYGRHNYCAFPPLLKFMYLHFLSRCIDCICILRPDYCPKIIVVFAGYKGLRIALLNPFRGGYTIHFYGISWRRIQCAFDHTMSSGGSPMYNSVFILPRQVGANSTTPKEWKD